MIVGYVEQMRARKWRRIVGGFLSGVPDARLVGSSFDADATSHVIYGQMWSAMHLVPDAIRSGKPYWHLDNGWMMPGRGEVDGYYRVTRNSPSPVFLRDMDPSRADALGATIQPWRADGGHVLICLPGEHFGRPWGLDMRPWIAGIEDRVASLTTRHVVVRPKNTDRALWRDLVGAWCVVTHSSNVAVEAVLAGVPAIVEDTSPTAPLGNVGLTREALRTPELSDLRGEWLASLAWQQFTIPEMRAGDAWRALASVGLGERAAELVG